MVAAMSCEISELKRHTRWLEDQLKSQIDLSQIEDQLDEMGGTIDGLSDCLVAHSKVVLDVASKLQEVCDRINKQTAAINSQREAIMKLAEVLLPRAPQTGLETKQPSHTGPKSKPNLNVVKRPGDSDPEPAA